MSKLTFNQNNAPATPVAGKGIIYMKSDGLMYSKSSDGVERALTSPGTFAANSILANYRNRLINGGFNINQRGVNVGGAGNSWAHNAYCMDRWWVQTETTSSSNILVTQLVDPENIQTECVRLTQPDLLAKRMGIVQCIESANIRHLKGQAVTLSGRIRSSLAQNVRFALLFNTGTADSITHNLINSWSSTTYTANNFFTTAAVNGGLATGNIAPVANTWTPFTLNATLPATVKNVTVFIWTEGTYAQNNTLDIGQVQLEPGSTASAFENRLYGLELSLAQRYYWSTFPVGTIPALNINTNDIVANYALGYHSGGYQTGWVSPSFGINVPFPVPQRIVPTITSYNSQSTTNSHFNAAFGAQSWSNINATLNAVSLMFVTSSWANSYSNVQARFHLTADSDI